MEKSKFKDSPVVPNSTFEMNYITTVVEVLQKVDELIHKAAVRFRWVSEAKKIKNKK